MDHTRGDMSHNFRLGDINGMRDKYTSIDRAMFGNYPTYVTDTSFISNYDTLELKKRPKEFILPKDNIHKFNHTLKEILEAIIDDKEIDNIKLADKVQDPDFHFKLELNPELGTSLSDAFTAILSRARSVMTQKRVQKASEKRNQQANEYAAKMYEVITNLKVEAGVSSFRGTVDLLKQRNVQAPNGGKEWHISTLQDLQKRWRELGLIPSPKPK